MGNIKRDRPGRPAKDDNERLDFRHEIRFNHDLEKSILDVADREHGGKVAPTIRALVTEALENRQESRDEV